MTAVSTAPAYEGFKHNGSTYSVEESSDVEAVVGKHFGETGNAVGFISLLNKIAEVFSLSHLRERTGGFLAASALIGAPGTFISWIKTVKTAADETFRGRHVVVITRDSLKVIQSVMRVIVSVSTQCTQGLSNACKWFDLAIDSFKMTVHAMDLHETVGVLQGVNKEIETTPKTPDSEAQSKLVGDKEVARAAKIKMGILIAKISEAAIGIIVGVLVCVALCTGVGVIPPMVAACIGLATALFGVGLFYTENLLPSLKSKVVPVSV